MNLPGDHKAYFPVNQASAAISLKPCCPEPATIVGRIPFKMEDPRVAKLRERDYNSCLSFFALQNSLKLSRSRGLAERGLQGIA